MILSMRFNPIKKALMQKIISTVCSFAYGQLSIAQQIIFGTNIYVEYHAGTFPL
jgi:hypothetical protein